MSHKIKNIYISGCGGMLGDAFYKIYSKNFNLRCSDKIVDEPWLHKLDFTNYLQYFDEVKNHKSDLLIHLGAMTDLEQCEKNPKITYLNNTKSVEYAVKISNILNIPIMFISTAGIFDGKKSYYIDDDKPNPISHYGKSKYESEKFVELNSKNYLIFRAGWMMGGGEKKDKKFVYKILKQIKNGKKILNIVNDKNGTPTYTFDFANQTMKLINNNIRGKYNLVCEGLTSRIEVVFEILKFYQLEKKIIVNEVTSDFFSDKYFVKRPLSERLINEKLNILKLNVMRNWKVCLNEYLENDFKEFLNENN